MPPLKKYNKPALTAAALVAHLQDKGLEIRDLDSATESIESIGYYRLLIYMRPFQDATKHFSPATAVDDILELYEFDRKLRLLCLDAIERIEVALRSALINKLAVPYGPHFYVDQTHYANARGWQNFLDNARDAQYLAITHYRNTYSSPAEPPIWAVLEALTFGALSHFFADLSLPNRKLIAKVFAFDEKVLVSWFRAINTLRNMCAHHNRLWNFTFLVNQPMMSKSLSSTFSKPDTFHARAVILAALINSTGTAPDWKPRLIELLKRRPAKISPTDMGFPSNWEAESFWL